jgi:hypothetical protein
MAGQFCLRFQLPRKLQGSFHAANLRHGTDGFTSPPKEGMLWIFSPWKIRRLRPGSNYLYLYPFLLEADSTQGHSAARRIAYTKFLFCLWYVWVHITDFLFQVVEDVIILLLFSHGLLYCEWKDCCAMAVVLSAARKRTLTYTAHFRVSLAVCSLIFLFVLMFIKQISGFKFCAQ